MAKTPRILKDLTQTTAPAPALDPKPHPLGADVVATTAAAIDDEGDGKSRQVAVHTYLTADGGSEVDDEEEAHGISYVLLSNTADPDSDKLPPVNWLWNEASESERRMFAVFGAKTLATNISSQRRNNKKLAPTERHDGAVQRQNVLDRFAMIRAGQWIDRTPSEGGPKVDKEALAGAIVDVKLSEKKIQESERDDEYSRIRQRLEDDVAYLRKARLFPPVAAAYAARKGIATMTADDL